MNNKYKFMGIKNRNPIRITNYNYTKINVGGFVEHVNAITRRSQSFKERQQFIE